MNTASSLRTVALVLIVVGLLVWLTGLVALVRGQHWRFGIGVGGLLVFVGCCLWHAARVRGGTR